MIICTLYHTKENEMYVLVLVVLTSIGGVEAKPLGKTDTLEICEEAKTLMLEQKPLEVWAGAVCIKVDSI